jgi:dihydropteroate synthase
VGVVEYVTDSTLNLDARLVDRSALSQKIFGILNITEDSFFDGGLYLEKRKMEERAKDLVEQGAGVLDLGAASSHPEARRVSASEEIARLQPAIAFCKTLEVKISVDSSLSEVQLYAIEQGVDFLNDVTGFSEPAIYEKLAASGCKLIVMHSVGKTKIAADAILDCIIDFFHRRLGALTTAGVKRDNIILDTGMGFFLSPDPNISFQVLQNLKQIKRIFQLPLLLGVSRKSFIQKSLQKPAAQISAAGAYLETLLLSQGADYIRTHSPQFLHDFALMKEKINSTSDV